MRGPLPDRSRFPIPLVGTAAILVVLIVFTPILFATGPPAAGTFETLAELVVDEVAGSGRTTVYVHAVGSTVRYGAIALGLAGNFSWTGACPTGLGGFVWQNGSNLLEEQVGTTSNPLVVVVSATYVAGGATANYSAKIAFFSTASTIASAACYGATPPAGPQAIASLPLVLLLQNYGPGGPP